MSPTPADEPPIDTALSHYMEERALANALEKAATPEQQAKVRRLADLRAALMQERAAFQAEAVAKRHARGEIHSAARVAAINAIGPGKAEMDQGVRTLYERQPDAGHVLKAHARSHFAFVLVSARLSLSYCTPDVIEAARTMQAREDAFAAAWLDAIDDPAFKRELAAAQRDALRSLRTSTRAMHFATDPGAASTGDIDARVLGKVWNKLDDLAHELGVEPLSTFIAVPGEDDGAGVEPGLMLPTINALLEALPQPERKIPSKKAAVSALSAIRNALVTLGATGGKAWFDVDI